VVSLKPDSEISVWATFGRMLRRSKRGMRMAGSVEANTAPISSATGKATPNMGATARATMTVVVRTPGKANKPSPTATLEITRNEMPTPPWNKIRETPSVKMSWAPAPFKGFSTMPSTDGPINAPTATNTIISGIRKKVASNCETKPAPKMRPKSRRMCSTSTNLSLPAGC
jgi:hypothetical protein